MFAMTLCLGAFIGFLVGYLKLNSLIVTLGMLSAIHGLTLTYSGGKNMDIANKDDTWFAVFGQSSALGIPVPILIFGLLAAVLGMVLAKTPFGRKVYAVGGNGVAATFSGIRRARVVFTCYLLSAFCVATAGLIQASRSLGSQNTVGQGLELEVLAAVILGGASLLGGSGTIFKTIDRRADPRLHPERPAARWPAVLRAICGDLGHHHPGCLARHRRQARSPVVSHRVRAV
jgi:ribose transport system permease protein